MNPSEMKKGALLYEGKAKKVYEVRNSENLVWLEFKNDLTAFNAEKQGSFKGKGWVNLNITEILFKELKKHHIKTHWVKRMTATQVVVEKLKMISLEVVVRNTLAGSTAKKFNLKEGTPLETPLFELFYKDDSLGDPFVNESQALMLKAVDNISDLTHIEASALDINDILVYTFDKVGIQLVDLKMEFGYTPRGDLCLADEISPDSCRLWDKKTQEKLDKDRFRRGLGQVSESYLEVSKRLESEFPLKIKFY